MEFIREFTCLEWYKLFLDFLVWIALSVSIGGTLISLLLGWKLPSLEYRNQVVEAKMRKQLVFSEDDFSARATATLFPMFYSVRRNYYRLFNWYMGFGVWQTAFGLCVGNYSISCSSTCILRPVNHTWCIISSSKRIR